MKNLAIARRYAKALMLIGKEDGQAEKYREELSSLAELFNQGQELGQTICNPLYDAGGRKKVLEVVIGKLDASKVMTSFMLLLFEKGRIGFIANINDFYQKLADDLKGIGRASVISASKLSSDAVEKIRESLSKMTGKEIKLDVEEDSSLIGGVVTKIGDLVLDGSIKAQLLNMRESLKRGERV
jgi:F-type H+-transporting ATPase subunit delta